MAGNDASSVASVLAGGVPDDGLQHAGQAVLRCSTSSEFISAAKALIDSLSQRNWSGDPELIAELVHVRNRTTSELALLAVHLDEIGEALDQSPASVSYIDLAHGTVWPGELLDVDQGPENFDADDSDRFIATIDHPDLPRDCEPRSTGPVHFDASRLSSAGMTTSTPAGIVSVTMPASDARAWLADHGYRSTR